MFQLASIWLIPVANRYRPVNSHPYLFKSALSWGTPPLDEAIIDKKLWCDLMEIFTKTFIEFFGCNGRVIAATIPSVPNDPAVTCLPVAIALLSADRRVNPAARGESECDLDRGDPRLSSNHYFYVAILYDGITSGYSQFLCRFGQP